MQMHHSVLPPARRSIVAPSLLEQQETRSRKTDAAGEPVGRIRVCAGTVDRTEPSRFDGQHRAAGSGLSRWRIIVA